MSTTGEPAYYQSAPEVRAWLLAPVPSIATVWWPRRWRRSRSMSSPRYFDPDEVARSSRGGVRPVVLPGGHAAADGGDPGMRFTRSGLRSPAGVPTLVIHGWADTLILPSGGQHTAEMIPGANLLLLHDMGHDLPRPLWPLLRRRHRQPHHARHRVTVRYRRPISPPPADQGRAAHSGCARTLPRRRCRCTLAAGSGRSRARRSVA